MENIRQYLLSLISAAVICAIVINIVGKKSALTPILKLLAGLFMIYTALAPWTKFHIDNMLAYFSDLEQEASIAASCGNVSALQATAAIIKEQTEAYILDKASSMGADITVEVMIENTDPPIPCSIEIKGTIAPYHKQRLEQIIISELSIPKENIMWT